MPFGLKGGSQETTTLESESEFQRTFDTGPGTNEKETSHSLSYLPFQAHLLCSYMHEEPAEIMSQNCELHTAHTCGFKTLDIPSSLVLVVSIAGGPLP